MKAAKIIKKKFNNEIPCAYDNLIILPGIGDYTAKAILGIAYNNPVMPIDSNIERIIARIYGLQSPLMKIKKKLKDKSNLFISKKSSSNLIQAFMDYGSLGCTPRNPDCKSCLIKSLTNNYQSFSSGKSRDILIIDDENFDLKILPLICYEIIYSGDIFKDSNFDFIINISEDGWFGESIGPHQHFSPTSFRAIEEGKNIIRSTNNGISAYIDSNGIVISKLESTKKGVIEINNYKKFNETLFSKFGNKIFFYILLFYVVTIFLIKRWENK